MGRYQGVFSFGDGTFAVNQDYKFGVVDKDENIIVDFDDVFIELVKLGSNYIAVQEDTLLIFDAQGKKMKKSAYQFPKSFSITWNSYIEQTGN